MDHKKVIKNQFNKQARDFSDWSVAKNEEYMQGFFEFSGITQADSLLDMACGTGDFAVFCAKRIQHVHGLDISEGMIEIAQKKAMESGLSNVLFQCHDVENIPWDDESFSVVACRSAFHHMDNYSKVLKEMRRCCKQGGHVAVLDIMAFENQTVDSFFEVLERQIDVSHNATLSRDAFINVFHKTDLDIVRHMDVEIVLNFREYLGHAHQKQHNLDKIDDFLEHGLQDKAISDFLFLKDDELVFKRKVFLILGQKNDA